MNHWILDPTHPDDGRRQACVQALIGATGQAGFAGQALAALHPLLGAGTMSVYQVWAEHAPVLHLSGSWGVADNTRDCFRAYADGLYRRDRSFDVLRDAPQPGRTAMLHMRAEEAPNADHREQIYRRHGMRERLSLAWLEGDGSLLAINLYRHGDGRGFGAAATEHLAALAPVLRGCVQRQLADGAGPAGPREALRRRCAGLTDRELDVCERLLRGMSHDGVAADLGLSVATVKTYRARAFARLGLHFRSELFAAFAGTH